MLPVACRPSPVTCKLPGSGEEGRSYNNGSFAIRGYNHDHFEAFVIRIAPFVMQGI